MPLAGWPMTTLFHVSRNATPGADAALRALRDAGFDVRQAPSLETAREAAGEEPRALVLCDLDVVPRPQRGGALPHDVARTISHELRTPLSAMAGWLHLLETGKLDEAGLKRAVQRLRGNIEDQVKTIERYLGTSQEGKD
jgi:signal transduction histidine kinase